VAETVLEHEMDTSKKKESIKEPTTPEETLALHNILRSDPHRYLRIINEWLDENPTNSQAYFDRHYAWMKMGKPRQAIKDLDKAVELNPDMASFFARALVHRHLGQYEEARKDFGHGEALDPREWEDDVFGLFYQADTYARLGDEAAALAYWARLPDDFWTPGVYGAPGGGKADIADKLRRTAADARRKLSGGQA
jgi:tetratricopeptide (TPR) repeat protein